MNNRDRIIIEKIIDYCDQLKQTCQIFESSLAEFS